MASGRPDSFAVPTPPDPVTGRRRVKSTRKQMSRGRLRTHRAAALAAFLSVLAALLMLAPATDTAAAASLGLHVSGNQLLDANGSVVHFHGVDRSGTEYACIQGWGIFDGPSDDASIAAIASW